MLHERTVFCVASAKGIALAQLFFSLCFVQIAAVVFVGFLFFFLPCEDEALCHLLFGKPQNDHIKCCDEVVVLLSLYCRHCF